MEIGMWLLWLDGVYFDFGMVVEFVVVGVK